MLRLQTEAMWAFTPTYPMRLTLPYTPTRALIGQKVPEAVGHRRTTTLTLVFLVMLPIHLKGVPGPTLKCSYTRGGTSRTLLVLVLPVLPVTVTDLVAPL